MKTIGEHISNIRALLKLYGRTPEGYTDESLYSLFSVSRAELLKQQIKKFDAVSENNWLQVCMSLEVSKSHNCDCVPDNLECKVLKSKYKIYPVIVGRNNSKLKIRTIGGKNINLVTEAEWFRRKDRPTNEYYGSLINSYLIIWNAPLSLKVILVSGIWTDPMDYYNIPSCDLLGSPVGTCFDPLAMEYPLQEEYVRVAYEMTLKLLGFSNQIKQDLTNDSNESIKS